MSFSVRQSSAPSHEAEPGALEVTVEGKRDRSCESPHDGEADAVREAQASVIQALVHIEGASSMASSVRMTWTTRLAKSRRAKRTARAGRSRTPISVPDSSRT